MPPSAPQNPVLGLAPDKDIPYAQDDVRQDPWDNRQPIQATQTWVKLVINNHPLFKSVEELFQDVEGTPFDAGGSRSYVRLFLVTAKANIVGPVAVCKCPGLPVPYAPYIPYRVEEYDLSARLIRLNARRRGPADDWQQWVVRADYSSQLPPGGHPDFLTDVGWPTQAAGWMNQPWLEPPHLEWDPETSTKIPDIDRLGKPYLNSVRQPFATPISVEQGNPVLVVTRNFQHQGTLIAIREHIERYSMAVNSDTFVGAPPGAVRLDPIKMTEMYRGRLRYWRAVYRFRFKKRVPFTGNNPERGNLQQWDTWQPRVLDNGMFRYRVVFGNRLRNQPPVPIMMAGHPVSFPVPLDGDGGLAPRDANGRVTPYYHQFTEYETLPFSQLVLPGYKL